MITKLITISKIITTSVWCLVGVFFSGCLSASDASAPALTLIDQGEARSVIVYDKDNKAEAFAVKELQEIVKGSTGVELSAVGLDEVDSLGDETLILVGRHELVSSAISNERLGALRDEESLVTSSGGNLILTGGDDWGAIYAVYDFVENEMGYRCYAPYPGGEKFVSTDQVIYSGVTTQKKPAFTGYRIVYVSPVMFRDNISAFARYSFRNRGTQLDWESYGEGKSYANHIGLKEKYKINTVGHAFTAYIPAYDATWSFYKEGGQKGSFEEHPEYFTLNAEGVRVDNIQMCLSNTAARDLLTERVIEAVEALGPGAYMVGSNDHSTQRYCWCEGCLEFEEKYDSVGGPLWDYILELCDILKDDYPDVYIQTLAYKGPQQTEKAPKGVQFPANFIIDAAFLNSTQTLTELPPLTLENGEIYDRYKNLEEWVRITDHAAFWFYGGAAPYQIYERVQKEINELNDVGVESVGACELGSMEFGDLTTYLYFRLLAEPDLDVQSEVRGYLDFKYGAAATDMLAFIDELETIRRESDPRHLLWATDTYEQMTFLEAGQILRWQNEFDDMLKLVENDPIHSRNVRIARTAVDCWTILQMPKIRSEYPDSELDASLILERGLQSSMEAIEAGMLKPDRSPAALTVFQDMSLYANLLNDSLPVELSGYERSDVIRYLPVLPETWRAAKAGLSDDLEAVAGKTMKQVVTIPEHVTPGVKYEWYDSVVKEWVIADGRIPLDGVTLGEYQLHELFTARLPARVRLVFAERWGTSLDILKLGRYYDPTFHHREYEIWASLKFEGPLFDPNSADIESTISCDQIFMVNKGTPD